MIPKNATTAAALVGGYLLGRTRKAKLAIGVGMFLAGRRLDLDPRRIGKLLAASPVAGALSEQVRRELFEATKSAATQALTKRASGLADSLQERTRALGREDRDDTDTDDGREVEDAADGDGDVDGDQESSRPAASAKSTAKRTTKSTAKSAAKKSTSRSSARSGSSGGSPRKATAARKRTSAPRKATASRTRKSRSDSDE
ncbi:hypothetical protein [Streptomyces sp. NPDC056524]|uniref:hypothetical protein n=1 Tax=Streptomyces sp. NPDC056524 TaxID=3345851 RepID=UPI0036977E63